jgi:hypothetical protein
MFEVITASSLLLLCCHHLAKQCRKVYKEKVEGFIDVFVMQTLEEVHAMDEDVFVMKTLEELHAIVSTKHPANLIYRRTRGEYELYVNYLVSQKVNEQNVYKDFWMIFIQNYAV